MKARERVLAVLADAGVTEPDYRKVEKARQLVDEVNAALAGRGSPLIFAVTLSSAYGPTTGPAPADVTE